MTKIFFQIWSTAAGYGELYNNQINARALISPSAMDYCAGKPIENRASSELFKK